MTSASAARRSARAVRCRSSAPAYTVTCHGLLRRRHPRDRRGPHRVPARLQHRPPDHRGEAARAAGRRPRRHGVHRGHPDRARSPRCCSTSARTSGGSRAAWFRGLFRPEYRGHFDHRFGWYIIVGSIPIGVVGFLGKDVISGPLRSLWWVGGSLMRLERRDGASPSASGSQDRGERDLTMLDTRPRRPGPVLRPGAGRLAVRRDHLGRPAPRARPRRRPPGSASSSRSRRSSRPGSTSSRTSCTATSASGPTVVGTLVSFVVAYAAVAWLLKFVAGHSIAWFVPYRLVLGFARPRPARDRRAHRRPEPSQPAGALADRRRRPAS